jgi:hypothetical protein
MMKTAVAAETSQITCETKQYRKGTRIVQADSGRTPIPRVGASRRKECPLLNSAGACSGGRLWRVGADSLRQTVYRYDFLIPVPTLGIGVGT